MKNFKKNTTTIFFASLLTMSVAQAAEPIYECTPSETSQYIKAVTFNLHQPSSIPDVDQARAAYLEKVAESGDADCLGMLMGKLDDEWKTVVEAIDSIPGTFTSLSGAIYEAIMSAYDQIEAKVMEELNKGMCERLDAGAVAAIASEIAGNKLAEMTGIDINDIRSSAEGLMKDEMNTMFGEDSKYFYDAEKFSEDKLNGAKSKARAVSDDFWKDI
jgi:hypothetical protein